MMQTLVFLVCAVVAATAETCDPSYSDICADHTMCIYPEVGEACGEVHTRGVTSDAEIQEILEQHNKYRSKVALGHATRGNPGPQPSAANMNQLTYDDRLAKVAQRWSDQCLPKHDKCNDDSRFLGNIVGQNVYGTNGGDIRDANWTAAVEMWFEEITKFNPKNIDPFVFNYKASHYTQLVWADTTLVGCGYTSYQTPDGENHEHYVCNYGIGGNIESPGFSVYKVGEPFGEACGEVHTRGVTSDAEIQEILEQHNKYRSKVALGHATRGNPGPQPSAANMNQLTYDDRLAKVAQRWSDQCLPKHDKCNDDSRFLGNIVGQNVYGTNGGDIRDANWTAAVEMWFEEITKFNPKNIDPFVIFDDADVGSTGSCNVFRHRGVTSASDKQAVVDIHNQLRSKVALGKGTAGKPGPQPPAANMKKLHNFPLGKTSTANTAMSRAETKTGTDSDPTRRQTIGTPNITCATTDLEAISSEPPCTRLELPVQLALEVEVGEACGEVHYRGLASDAEIQEILEQHNKYRSKVALGHATRGNPGPQPSAANMNQLTYDDRLSWVAQPRFLGNIVGQNVFSWASMRTDDIIDANWTMAVESWFEEIQYFNPQDIDPFVFHYNSAHYTQLVWADTTLVGCGYTAHQTPDGMNHRHYVCNYGIGGNINSPGFSVYKTYDDRLSWVAQRWSDQCLPKHDKCKKDSRFLGNIVGQNVFSWASMRTDDIIDANWTMAVESWFEEIQYFNPQDIDPFVFHYNSAHYTQLVWADTTLVGCGYTAHQTPDGMNHRHYVCNYGIGGNINSPGFSVYKTYDDRLSWVAQRWSDQCLPKHDKCKKDSRFLGNIVGQNVFSWASMRTDDIIDANWTMAVESWFEEIQYFNPQDIDPFVILCTSGSLNIEEARLNKKNK
ncbi:hypothetical protein C0J52_23206 [Blattella germanica]|nr:hypothetical protein C0J52_23206 [Blattella germanica]